VKEVKLISSIKQRDHMHEINKENMNLQQRLELEDDLRKKKERYVSKGLQEYIQFERLGTI